MKRYIKSDKYTSARGYKDPKSKKIALKEYLSEVNSYLHDEFGEEIKDALDLPRYAPFSYANYDSDYFLHIWIQPDSMIDKAGQDIGEDIWPSKSMTTYSKAAKDRIRYYIDQAFDILASKGFDIKTSPKNVGGQFYVVATTEELDNILEQYS